MFHAVTPPAVVGSHREYYNKYPPRPHIFPPSRPQALISKGYPTNAQLPFAAGRENCDVTLTRPLFASAGMRI